jgi:hypothetical protein
LNGLKLTFEVILSWSFVPPQSLMLCRCCRQLTEATSSLAVPVPFGVFFDVGQPLTPRKNHLSGLRCLLSVSHALKAFNPPNTYRPF